jgi:hypothetical protein
MPNPKHNVVKIDGFEFYDNRRLDETKPWIIGYGVATFADGKRGEVRMEIGNPEDGRVQDDVVYFEASIEYLHPDDDASGDAYKAGE